MKPHLFPSHLQRYLKLLEKFTSPVLVPFLFIIFLVSLINPVQCTKNNNIQLINLPTAKILLVNLDHGPIRTVTDKVNQEVVLTVQTRYSEAYLFECNASFPVEWNYIGEGNPTTTADVGRHFKDFYDVNSYTYQSILYLYNLEELQTGRYVCRGSNPEQEKIQVHYDLFVPGNRSRILLADTDKEIFASESKPLVTLPCSVTDPNMGINLYKGNSWGTFQMIETNHSIQFRPRKGFILKLNELPDPFGTYLCTTQNNKIRRTIHLIPERLKAKHDINHLHGQIAVDISYDFEYNRVLCCTGGSPYIPKLQWAGCGSVLDCKIKSVCFEEDRCEPRHGESGSVTHWFDPGPLPKGCAGWKLKNDPGGDFGIFKCSTPGVTQYQPYLLNRGNIFLDFDKAPASETILTLTKSTDESVFVGSEVEYHCNSTRFYFSYGIRWAFQKSNGDIEFVEDSMVVNDRYSLTSHKRQTTFKIMNEDIKGIICFVPIVNSPTEWRTVSLPITIRGGGHPHLPQLSSGNNHNVPHYQIDYLSSNMIPHGPSASPNTPLFMDPETYSTSRPNGYFSYQTEGQRQGNGQPSLIPKIDIAEVVQQEILFKPSAAAPTQHSYPLPTYQPHPLLAALHKEPHPHSNNRQTNPGSSSASGGIDSHTHSHTSQGKPIKIPTVRPTAALYNFNTSQFLREREQNYNQNRKPDGYHNLQNNNDFKEPLTSPGGNQINRLDHSSSSLIYKQSPDPHMVSLRQEINHEFDERNFDVNIPHNGNSFHNFPHSGEGVIRHQYPNQQQNRYESSYQNPNPNPTDSRPKPTQTKIKPKIYFASYETLDPVYEKQPIDFNNPIIENFHLKDIPSSVDSQQKIHCDSQGKRCSLRTSPNSSQRNSGGPSDSPEQIPIKPQQRPNAQPDEYTSFNPHSNSPLTSLDLSDPFAPKNSHSSSSSKLSPHRPTYSTLSQKDKDYYTESLMKSRTQERKRTRVKSTTTTEPPYNYYTSETFNYKGSKAPPLLSKEAPSSWETDDIITAPPPIHHSFLRTKQVSYNAGGTASSSSLEYKENNRERDDKNNNYRTDSNRHDKHYQQQQRHKNRKHSSYPSEDERGEDLSSDENYYYQRYAPLESSSKIPSVQLQSDSDPSPSTGNRKGSSKSRIKTTMQSYKEYEDDEEESVGINKRYGYLYGDGYDVPLLELG